MKALYDKWKSNKGSSMILVLALVLICMMVSSVVVSMAASGSSRNLHRTHRQRAYMAISSACDLLVAELTDMGCVVYKSIDREFGCEICQQPAASEWESNWYDMDEELQAGADKYNYRIYRVPGEHDADKHTEYMDETETTLHGLVAEVIKRGVNAVYSGEIGYEETLTLELDESIFGEEETRLPIVNCRIKVYDNYNIGIALTTEHSDYTISIALSSGYETETDSEEVTSLCNHKVRYNKIQGNGSYAPVEILRDIKGQIHTGTFTLQWSAPTVTKGVDIE